jgi:hypothetical protein
MSQSNTEHMTRRAALKGAAALALAAPAVAAGAVPALAARDPDADLRRLWGRYTDQCDAEVKAYETMRPVRALCDAEAEAFPCPADVVPGDHDRAVIQLIWRKHGLDRLYDEWNAAAAAKQKIADAIHAIPAQTLTGVGIKLAAWGWDIDEMDGTDFHRIVYGVVADIERLTDQHFDMHSPDGKEAS